MNTDTESDIIGKGTPNEESEETDGVRIRDGGERDRGTDTSGQVLSVEGGARPYPRRRESGRIADREAARLVNKGREVSVASLGVAKGSKLHTVRLVETENETASMRQARKEAESRGLTVKFFAGGNLVIEEDTDENVGRADKDKTYFEANGYIRGNVMLVRADHHKFTADQIARHEAGHDKIAKGEIDVDAVRERLVEIVGEENVDLLAENYSKAYEGSGYNEKQIWEECICDSLGDMNIFARNAEAAETMAMALPDIKKAIKDTSKSPTQTRGSPQVVATDVRAGKKANEVDYGRQDVDFDALRKSRKENRQHGKASRDFWYPKLTKAEWDLLNRRLGKELETSDNFIDKSTKWLYADFNGTKVFAIYGIGDGTEATVLYAVGGASATTLNSWRIKYESNTDQTKRNAYRRHIERISVEQNKYVNKSNGHGTNNIGGYSNGTEGKANGIGQISPGSQRGNNRGTVSQDSTQGKASRELDTEYLSAVERGDLETAQRMVDEAAKKAGYNEHLYHGTNADFTEFDLRKHGGRNGKGEGYGIYLAANREISAPYGKNVIDSYVKFNRLAEGRKKTLSYNEVENLVKRSCEIEAQRMVDDEEYDSVSEALKDTWVSNIVYTYGYSSIEQVYSDVANKLWEGNDNDGDLINEIMALSGAHYDYNNALDFYDSILTPVTGIDGFHYIWGNKDGSGEQNDIYLAFSSEQIKSADTVTYDDEGNIIPLSKRFNPKQKDIRFSREFDTEDLYTSTADFYNQVSYKDRISFARSLANKTSGMKEDEARTVYIYCFTKVYVFRADGYMRGEMINSFAASDKQLLEDSNYDYDQIDQNTEIIALWSEAIQNRQGKQRSNSLLLEGRGRSDTDDRLSDDSLERYTSRYTERERQNFATKEEVERIVKELKKLYGVDATDSGSHGKASRELDVIDYMDELAEREGREIVEPKVMSDRELLVNALESIAQDHAERKKRR